MILRKDYYTRQRKAEAASVDKLERTYAVMLHCATGISANDRGISLQRGSDGCSGAQHIMALRPLSSDKRQRTLPHRQISNSASYPLALQAAQ